MNHTRLGAIEADRVDQALESAGRERKHLRRRLGAREQSLRRDESGLILGAETQDATNKRLEWIATLHRNETDDRRIPRRRLAPEHRQCATDGARIKRSAPRRDRARRFGFLA